MILHCGTTNAGKLREFQAALPGFEIRAVALPPPEETGRTFEENASRKALYYSAHTDGYVFADDSGLEVDALGGAPGVRSARFAGEGASDGENNALLLKKLDRVEDRSARFVCVIALARAGEIVETFRGVVEGRILETPRGSSGFGYDPLFFYPPFGCTFAEAGIAQKMIASHRGRALTAMLTRLREIAST